MKIVPPSVALIHCTPDPEMVIERYGRIAYFAAWLALRGGFRY